MLSKFVMVRRRGAERATAGNLKRTTHLRRKEAADPPPAPGPSHHQMAAGRLAAAIRPACHRCPTSATLSLPSTFNFDLGLRFPQLPWYYLFKSYCVVVAVAKTRPRYPPFEMGLNRRL
jgi:hypothetical protein